MTSSQISAAQITNVFAAVGNRKIHEKEERNGSVKSNALDENLNFKEALDAREFRGNAKETVTVTAVTRRVSNFEGVIM